jgi:PKD repeat protein
MEKKGSYWFLLFIAGCLLILWSSPGHALFPPCNVSAVQNGNTVTYSTVDPVSSQVKEESWTLNEAGQVKGVQFQGGIAAWIVDKGLEYEVHYRLFDPGRGMWKGDFYRVNGGIHIEINSLFINDGVVAWVTYIHLDLYDNWNREFCYVTYEPEQGIWVFDSDLWGPRASPNHIQVKDGVVAYFLASTYSGIDVLFSIFDPELKQWIKGRFSNHEDPVGINVNIQNATVHISSLSYDEGKVGYDSNNHVWQPGWDTQPRPSFTANPSSGLAPLWVCFWDTSIALSGGSWSWDFDDIGGSTVRSPVYRFNNGGTYSVVQTVATNSGVFQASEIVQVAPAIPPTGGITINGDAAYTNSLNVTLGLNYDANAKEMCFMNLPGIARWSAWEPVAPAKAYQLSSIHIVGQSLDGVKTVQVKFRNANTESQVYQDTIILDTTAPAVTLTLNDGAVITSNPSVKVRWSASDAIGVARMSYATVNEGDSFYMWSAPLYFYTPVQTYNPPSRTVKFSSKPGRKTVMVRFTDAAGNVAHAQASIQLQPAAVTFLPLLLGD